MPCPNTLTVTLCYEQLPITTTVLTITSDSGVAGTTLAWVP